MPTPDPRSVSAVLADTVTRFKAAGLDTPHLDAGILLEAATGLSRERIVANPDRVLAREELDRLSACVKRRLQHEPVSRILGVRQFWGREFEVTPDTLDPRPDSETLIEVALGLVKAEGLMDRPCRILDIGTGTGCLLLTLLVEIPTASGIGSDISAPALAVAQRNAERLGLSRRTSWLRTNGLDGVTGQFDLVVSNPPYITTEEMQALPSSVGLFDPPLALHGGHDGLDIYRQLIPGLPLRSPNGWIIFEVGAEQASAVVNLSGAEIGSQTAPSANVYRDLGGNDRCVAWKARPQHRRE